MKKTVLALAILGSFASAASAQTSVNIYGVVDAGFVRETGGAAGGVSKLSSGVSSGSRLGFKGTEDLGGGLNALFLLESGFNVDTGELGQSSQTTVTGTTTTTGVTRLFGRQAYVGLGGGFGTVTLGRQYTPHYLALVSVDPFGSGLAGTATNLVPSSGDQTSRMNNTIKYVSPNVAGFTAEAVYGFGEVAGDTSAQQQYGVGLAYAAGPVNVRLAHHNWDNDTATDKDNDKAKNTLLGATYDFKIVKAHAAFNVNKGANSSRFRNGNNPYNRSTTPAPSDDSRDWLLGVSVPFGAHTVIASYINKNDRTSNNRDANQLAIGYRYAISKRTDFYTAFARINNKRNASYTVGNSIEAGSGDKAFNIGMRHTF